MTTDEPNDAALATRYRHAIEVELAQLEALSHQTAADRAPVELDQQSVGRLSRMDAMQQQAMAQAVEQRRQTRHARLGAALKRMESGDFGYCLDCGAFIGWKRLDVDPTVPLCLACAGRSGR
ncbi:MAG: TraR/DksA C4-type zinc finger protein [Nitratireductor sp.]